MPTKLEDLLVRILGYKARVMRDSLEYLSGKHRIQFVPWGLLMTVVVFDSVLSEINYKLLHQIDGG